jgi:hypothetical protein
VITTALYSSEKVNTASLKAGITDLDSQVCMEVPISAFHNLSNVFELLVFYIYIFVINYFGSLYVLYDL